MAQKIDARDKGIEFYKSAIDRGSSFAAFIVARMYAQGVGVEVNKEQAFNYYTIASVGRYEPAYSFLGDCYERGQGTDRDISKALKWFKRAADADLIYGEYRYKLLKQ